MNLTKADFVKYAESLPEDSVIKMELEIAGPSENTYVWEDMKVRKDIKLPTKIRENVKLEITY